MKTFNYLHTIYNISIAKRYLLPKRSLLEKSHRSFVIILIILTSLFIGILIWVRSSNQTSELSINKEQKFTPFRKDKTKETIKENKKLISFASDTIPLTKRYSSSISGIKFSYPDSWNQIGIERHSLNFNGNTMAVTLDFSDTSTHSVFSITYHLPPYGEQLYKIYKSEFKNSKLSKSTTKISGNNALVTYTTKKTDIKGNIYDPHLSVIQVVFLERKNKGEYFIRFETPEPISKVEFSKFYQVISTIGFVY